MVKREDKTKNGGFTFVETLAVLAVSAVLASGTGIAASKLIETSKKVAVRNQIEQLRSAIQSYYLDCGIFPTEEQGLDALWQKPELHPVPEAWCGPYVSRKISFDPWGSDFIYLLGTNPGVPDGTPETIPFVIVSYGADKEEGGEGDGQDIISWQ